MKPVVPSRTEERLLVALRRRKEREKRRLFLAEGVRVVEELLDSGLVPALAICSPSLEDSDRGRAILQRLPPDVVRTVADARLRQMAATETPQGVVVAAPLPESSPADAHTADGSIVLVLDAVQDPGNLGTLVRMADAFAAAGVIALPGTVDPWNPKSVRAAAGSSFRVPILSMETAPAIEWLRERGFAILVADGSGRPVGSVRTPSRTALVVGNEGAGVGETWRAAAEALVAVPTPGRAESLNVAVATGILLYALVENRDGSG